MPVSIAALSSVLVTWPFSESKVTVDYNCML